MKLRVEIECRGSAYGSSREDAHAELARILTKLTGWIEEGYLIERGTHVLLDRNGNRTGSYSIVGGTR